MGKVKAMIGPQPFMPAQVISAWSEPSSKGTTVYEVQLRSNGALSCDCPGYLFQVNKITKLRYCKHCRKHLDEAQAILDGLLPRVFKQDPEIIQKLMGSSPPKNGIKRR